MTHVSLYRRWRPQTFEEIVGQERITRTLQNAIRAGRTSHAYLFAGHRGTGKTTTARLVAKALNCARGPTPTPCNQCVSCEAIARGVSMDVIEIDGASNTSVDDIRDLKEKIVLAPAQSRYKVYIIDEVHMLSTSAFNALLKTLEEPPAHAVFILVTTEPHRIPPTVLSRCQRFDFRRVSFSEIVGRLRTIASQERLEIDDAALVQIARSADGSVRDAESILDQLSAYADGPIARDLVTSVLGLVDEETAAGLVDAVIARDVAAALRLAQDATDAGKDPRQLLRTLLEYARDLLLVKTCGDDAAAILDAPQERFARLRAQTGGVAIPDLLRAVRVLNEAVADARWNTQPRLALEVAVIRLARPEMDPTLEGVVARLERLEGRSAGGPAQEAGRTSRPTAPAGPASPSRPAPASPQPRDEATGDAVAPAPPSAPPAAAPATGALAAGGGGVPEGRDPRSVTIEEVRRQWARVLEDIKRRKMLCHALLIEGTPLEVQHGTLIVALRSAYNFHVENLHRPENRDVVEAALQRVLGYPLRFQCRLVDGPEGAAGAAPGASAAGAIPAPSGQAVPPSHASAPPEDAGPRRDGPAAPEAAALVARAQELFGAEIIDERPAG
ncbi:MAG: DNA polymerase III subunit gamma/tau [Armatimonadota bacterium]|nr:DNA polymerase III subunit gamma/tau [Armatimonadota bacterium]